MSTYTPPVFRSYGIGGAGNFRKASSAPSIEITTSELTVKPKKRSFITSGIGGFGNTFSRATIETLPASTSANERPASIRSVNSGHYHGIGGAGNWVSTAESVRSSSESERSLI